MESDSLRWNDHFGAIQEDWTNGGWQVTGRAARVDVKSRAASVLKVDQPSRALFVSMFGMMKG